MVLGTWDLDCSHPGQMGGDELGIEQAEATGSQAGDKMDKGHLAGIARPGKHAFAKEGSTELDAIKATDELAVLPALEAVGMASVKELSVKAFDLPIDPGLGAALPGGSAGGNHSRKVLVACDREALASHRAGKAVTDMQAIERNNPARIGTDPVEARVSAGFGHREKPFRIGPQDQLRGQTSGCTHCELMV
jgi:hypothetical protein